MSKINYPKSKHILRNLKKSDFLEPMFIYPPGAENIRISCNCGNQFKPNWDKSLDYEMAPIQSKDGAIWVPITICFACDQCGERNFVEIPSGEHNGELEFFGDESHCVKYKDQFYSYCFVSIHPSVLEYVKNEFNKLKLSIVPERDPATWKWHTVDVFDGRWRIKRGAIGKKSVLIAKIQEFLFKIRDLNENVKFCITSTVFSNTNNYEKGLLCDMAQERALRISIFLITEWYAKNGFSTKFTIESQSNYVDNFSDFLIEKIGRSLYFDPIFHYISRGKFSGLPTSAPKGSFLQLDLADIGAFLIRRLFHLDYDSEKLEIPLECLGEVLWISHSRSGRMGSKVNAGFPFEYFER